MSKTRLTVWLFVAVALVVCSSCVKRSISVRSDPPDATVYLDGLQVGQTPAMNIPFNFYGTRQLALYKPGYLCEKRVVEIDRPWYSSFPIDIISELVIPWDISDRRRYYFSLKRAGRAEVGALMRHAHQTREIAKARIEGARRARKYKPRAYVVEDARKKFILWGPFLAPPRAQPIYSEPEKKTEAAE